ncbi:MAG: glycosyltransferase family 2 protein [Bacilli bacterium]
MMGKYKVSVIIPVYNVEKYLDDTMNSLINQTIGINNVEIVLVNDGSTDNSKKICLKYKDMYPDNIIFINKNNSGVSDSRNIGFKKSTSSYVLFLDSDDKLSKNFLKKTYKFLEKNKDINMVIPRVRFFESVSKWHYTDYIFRNKKKIVDINTDITFLKYHSTGILFRRNAIKNIKFDKNVKYGEDMKFVSEFLLQNDKFGLEKKAIFYYRKRLSSNSAVDIQFYDKSCYINTIKNSFIYTFKQSIKKYGHVLRYFQYYIMNSLCERTKLDVNIDDILNSKEKEEYFNNIKYLLSYIDDDIIMMQNRINLNTKIYFLKFKNGKDYKFDIKYNNGKIYINNNISELKYGEFISLVKIKDSSNIIKFYVKVNDYIFNDSFYVMFGGIKHCLEDSESIFDDVDTSFKGLDGKAYYDCKILTFSIPNDKNYVCNFLLNDEKVNYGISNSVFKHNAWPRQYKKLKNNMVFMEHKNIYVKKRLYVFKLVYYLFIDGIHVLRQSGLKIFFRKMIGD